MRTEVQWGLLALKTSTPGHSSSPWNPEFVFLNICHKLLACKCHYFLEKGSTTEPGHNLWIRIPLFLEHLKYVWCFLGRLCPVAGGWGRQISTGLTALSNSGKDVLCLQGYSYIVEHLVVLLFHKSMWSTNHLTLDPAHLLHSITLPMKMSHSLVIARAYSDLLYSTRQLLFSSFSWLVVSQLLTILVSTSFFLCLSPRISCAGEMMIFHRAAHLTMVTTLRKKK